MEPVRRQRAMGASKASAERLDGNPDPLQTQHRRHREGKPGGVPAARAGCPEVAITQSARRGSHARLGLGDVAEVAVIEGSAAAVGLGFLTVAALADGGAGYAGFRAAERLIGTRRDPPPGGSRG